MNINDLFEIAVKKKASDIHLVAGRLPLLRIDGDLTSIPKSETVTRPLLEKMIFGVLTPNQKEKFLKERDLDLSYEIPDSSRFRVNIFWERDSMGLAARIISSKIPTMEDIAMPQVAYEMTRAKQGLILVTGPTGCGKSTSLAAMINLVNQERTAHIITLEDPIE